MKNIKTDKLEKIINKIYTGRFDCYALGLLFIWIRPVVGDNKIMWDLANFVAHIDERDRGVSFEHIHNFVTNFIEVSEKGGIIYGIPSVFDKEKVMNELIIVLDKLNLNINRGKIIDQKDKIIECLLELMEEAEFHFNDPRIVKCFLKKEAQKMKFCLNLDLKGPVIKTSPNAIIQSNLFG